MSKRSIYRELLSDNVPVSEAIRNRKCTCCKGVIPKGELHLTSTCLQYVKKVAFKVPRTSHLCVLCLRETAKAITKSLSMPLWKRVQAWTRSTLGTKWTRRTFSRGLPEHLSSR